MYAVNFVTLKMSQRVCHSLRIVGLIRRYYINVLYGEKKKKKKEKSSRWTPLWFGHNCWVFNCSLFLLLKNRSLIHGLCAAVVEIPTVIFGYVSLRGAKKKKNHCWHSADRSPVHVGSMLVKNSGMRSAPSRPEVFPGTPWSLQYCHTQQRQRGRGRLWAIHGTLLRETRNPFRRLTSCRPCLKWLEFFPRSVDKLLHRQDHSDFPISWKKTKHADLSPALTWYLGALLHWGKFPLTSPLWSRLLSTRFQPQLWSSLPRSAT